MSKKVLKQKIKDSDNSDYLPRKARKIKNYSEISDEEPEEIPMPKSQPIILKLPKKVVVKKEYKEVKEETTHLAQQFKNIKLATKTLALDYGSSRSIFSVVNSNIVDITDPFNSTLIFKVSKEGNISCKNLSTFISNMNKTEIYNTPLHLKSKIGVGQRDITEPKVVLIDDNNEKIALNAKDLVMVAFNFYFKSKNQNLDNYDSLIVSCPNNFSYNELFQYKQLIKSAFPDWNGEVSCYYESEAALFCNLSNLALNSQLKTGHYLIIDQGDSTTNISLANVSSENINLSHAFLTFGGSELTNELASLYRKTLEDNGKTINDDELYKMKLKDLVDLKSDLLNSEEDVIPFSNGVYLVPKQYQKLCEKYYDKVSKEIEKLLKKNEIQKPDFIIFSGGSMMNQRQVDYLKKTVFKNNKSDEFTSDSYKNQVVKGLHFRHAIHSNLVVEKSPYAIYTIINHPNGKKMKRNLICVLKEGETMYKNQNLLGIDNNFKSSVYFPLVQISIEHLKELKPNLKDFDTIVYDEKLDEMILVLIGSMKFEKPKDTNLQVLNLQFGANWKNKNIDFKVWIKNLEDGKPREMIFELDKFINQRMTFQSLQDEDNEIFK